MKTHRPIDSPLQDWPSVSPNLFWKEGTGREDSQAGHGAPEGLMPSREKTGDSGLPCPLSPLTYLTPPRQEGNLPPSPWAPGVWLKETVSVGREESYS